MKQNNLYEKREQYLKYTYLEFVNWINETSHSKIKTISLNKYFEFDGFV